MSRLRQHLREAACSAHPLDPDRAPCTRPRGHRLDDARPSSRRFRRRRARPRSQERHQRGAEAALDQRRKRAAAREGQAGEVRGGQGAQEGLSETGRGHRQGCGRASSGRVRDVPWRRRQATRAREVRRRADRRGDPSDRSGERHQRGSVVCAEPASQACWIPLLKAQKKIILVSHTSTSWSSMLNSGLGWRSASAPADRQICHPEKEASGAPLVLSLVASLTELSKGKTNTKKTDATANGDATGGKAVGAADEPDSESEPATALLGTRREQVRKLEPPATLEDTLYDRLMMMGFDTSMLKVQYVRLVPSFDAKLCSSAVSADARTHHALCCRHPLPVQARGRPIGEEPVDARPTWRSRRRGRRHVGPCPIHRQYDSRLSSDPDSQVLSASGAFMYDRRDGGHSESVVNVNEAELVVKHVKALVCLVPPRANEADSPLRSRPGSTPVRSRASRTCTPRALASAIHTHTGRTRLKSPS